MNRGLGTQLRHLTDLLDGAVAAPTSMAVCGYRPRYTPVIRALLVREPATVTQLAALAGITQPAATQTIALMIREGLLCAEASFQDSRQKMIRMAPYGQQLLPQLREYWKAADRTADSLDAELPYSPSHLLTLATNALTKNPSPSACSVPAGVTGSGERQRRLRCPDVCLGQNKHRFTSAAMGPITE